MKKRTQPSQPLCGSPYFSVFSVVKKEKKHGGDVKKRDGGIMKSNQIIHIPLCSCVFFVSFVGKILENK